MATASSPAATQPGFDTTSAAFICDPYPVYRDLREYAPMRRMPFGFWIATRHREVEFVLRDSRLGHDFRASMTRLHGPAVFDIPVIRWLGRTMLTLDPPDHTRLRRLVVGAFSARRVVALGPRRTGRCSQRTLGFRPAFSTRLADVATGTGFRRRPGDDLTTALVQAEDEAGRLSE